MSRFAFIVCVLLAAVGCRGCRVGCGDARSRQAPLQLVGIVTAAGDPAENAVVSVDGVPWMTTGKDGEVWAASPPRAGQRISVRAALGHAALIWSAATVSPVTLELVPYGVVEGAVMGRNDGAIAGALVRLRPWLSSEVVAQTRTDEKGEYRLEAPEGRYEIIATAPTICDRTEEADLFAGRTLGVELTVFERTTLRGRLVDVAGAPLARVELHAAPDQSELCGNTTTTREDGSFELEGVGRGIVRFRAVIDSRAEPAGVRQRSPQLVLVAGEGRGRLLHVRVVHRGLPAAGCLVEVLREGAENLVTERTSAEGTATFVIGAAGRHRITGYCDRGSRTGLHTAYADVATTARHDTTVSITMDEGRGAALSGVVVDEEGQPIARANVTARMVRPLAPLDGAFFHSQSLAFDSAGTVTDQSGSFALADLRPARHLVEAWADGFEVADQTLDLPANSLRLTLRRERPLAAVRGRALGSSGAPVSELVINGVTGGTASGVFTEQVHPSAKRLVLRAGAASAEIDLTGKTSPGKTTDIGDILLRVPRRVPGRVLAPAGLEASCWVEVGPGNDGLREEVASDGTFSVEAPERPTPMRLSCTNGVNVRRTVTSSAEAIQIELPAGGTILGTVTGSSGQRLARGRATANCGDRVRDTEVRDGAFRIEHASGRCRVGVVGEDDAMLSAASTVEVPEGGTVHIALEGPMKSAELRVIFPTASEWNVASLFLGDGVSGPEIPGSFGPTELNGLLEVSTGSQVRVFGGLPLGVYTLILEVSRGDGTYRQTRTVRVEQRRAYAEFVEFTPNDRVDE